MSELRAITDQELGEAIEAYFDRAILNVNPIAITDRLGTGRRNRGAAFDLRRAVIATALAALLLLAGYQAMRFVGMLVQRHETNGIRGAVAVVANGEIQLINPVDGAVLSSIDPNASATCPTFSPDGSMLAYFAGVGPYALRLSDPDGSQPISVAAAVRPQIPSWPREGGGFVIVHDASQPQSGSDLPTPRSEVWLHEKDGRAVRSIYSGGSLTHASISPTGDWIAVWTGDHLVVVRPDGSERHAAPQHGLGSRLDQAPTWSPDGRRVAYIVSAAAKEMYIYNAGSLEEQRVSLSRDAWAPRWSPIDDRVAVSLAGADGARLGLLDPRSGTIEAISREPWVPGSYAWSPDGSRLVGWVGSGSHIELLIVSVSGEQRLREFISTESAEGCSPGWQAGDPPPAPTASPVPAARIELLGDACGFGIQTAVGKALDAVVTGYGMTPPATEPNSVCQISLAEEYLGNIHVYAAPLPGQARDRAIALAGHTDLREVDVAGGPAFLARCSNSPCLYSVVVVGETYMAWLLIDPVLIGERDPFVSLERVAAAVAEQLRTGQP